MGGWGQEGKNILGEGGGGGGGARGPKFFCWL